MHKFELPYNQQPDYFDYLRENESLRNYIHSIYTPAYIEDAENTRKQLITAPGAPKSFAEYTEHIKKIQDFGYEPNVLMQRKASYPVWQKYYDLGITHFTLSNDEVAAHIKLNHPEVFLVCSITKMLSFEDFFTKDLSMYDIIVLPFFFNRWLNGIKQLPTKYKYMLLANSCCCAYCSHAEEHWFNPKGNKMPCYYENDPYALTIAIQPDHLGFFDPYISMYKLVDREAPSKDIFHALQLYTFESDTYNAYEDWMNIHAHK